MNNHDDFDSFEWDDSKSERTFAERGFDFEFASHVFDGPYLEIQDERRDYGEIRYIVIGEIEGRNLTVVWTPRAGARRIVTAWWSSAQERRKYHEYRAQESA